jgi:hypothetical protein
VTAAGGAGGRVHFLCTAIGRGHPFYLDGIRQCLPPEAVGEWLEVLAICHGASGALWRLARALYRHGSSSGGEHTLYSRLRARTDYRRAGLAVRVMGAPLVEAASQLDGPLVVAHPLLVAILHGRARLAYQHGELAVPREALLDGAHTVLVPDSHAADAFVRAGLSAAQVIVTGLCVEPVLVPLAAPAMAARIARLDAHGPLTGGFFSSGAEPRLHVQTLVAAAQDVTRNGGRAILVARRGGSFHRLAISHGARSADLALFETRAELEAVTAACFASLDYVVAPAHERSHWALGLGLPLFALEPAIGSFAPLNRARLLEERVALPLARADASAFGSRLRHVQQNGELARMAERGWRRYDIHGFAQAARAVLSLS